ncbi:xylulose kinase, partial [candidate division KSB3 bacterium]|nr:xylulose kinase [candidate division KSB3 bacterium]MBD3326772.1 xylulose kinase [candidate division KSB3 bacterium]
ANGLFYLPHLRGAGTPFCDPLSRGAFIGLRATHSQPDLMRAILEGVGFELRIIIETMQRVFGSTVDVVNTIGGGTRNLLWQEIRASILNLPIELPDVEEATSKGAALLAGIGIGLYQDFADASQRTHRLRRRIDPDPALVERYADLFVLYQQIYPALQPLYAQIAAQAPPSA